jgi:hypothetical protein
MKITSGSHTVVEAGSVLSFGAEPLTLHYAEGEQLEVHLVKPGGNEPAQITLNPETMSRRDGVDVLELRAAPGANGWGPASPISLTANGEPQWLVFRVSVYGNFTSFLFEYTFYRQESNNG